MTLTRTFNSSANWRRYRRPLLLVDPLPNITNQIIMHFPTPSGCVIRFSPTSLRYAKPQQLLNLMDRIVPGWPAGRAFPVSLQPADSKDWTLSAALCLPCFSRCGPAGVSLGLGHGAHLPAAQSRQSATVPVHGNGSSSSSIHDRSRFRNESASKCPAFPCFRLHSAPTQFSHHEHPSEHFVDSRYP